MQLLHSSVEKSQKTNCQGMFFTVFSGYGSYRFGQKNKDLDCLFVKVA